MSGGQARGWAFVTGGGGDIGGAICDKLARNGFAIACADINEAAAERTAQRLIAAGGVAAALTMDVTDEAAVNTAARRALDLGDVRVLVNGAGRAHAASIFGMDYATWQADIRVNLDAAFLCIHAFHDHFVANGGCIVNIASVNGLGMYGHPAYSAAKAGLIHFTKCLAVEYGPYNIRVNAVAPGTVRTRAWESRLAANPAVFDEVKAWYPLRRISEPADIAAMVGFLASDEASMITGTVMTVDGGLTAGVPALSATITQNQR